MQVYKQYIVLAVIKLCTSLSYVLQLNAMEDSLKGESFFTAKDL